MNIWKVGSRWNESGNKNASVIDIFRRNHIVFVSDEKLSEINEEDIIVIADGIMIIALAKVVGKAFTLDSNNCKKFIHLEPWDKFSLEDFNGATAIKVQIQDLSIPIKYVRSPKVCRIYKKEICSQILQILQQKKKHSFDIKTSVYRLFDTRHDNQKTSLICPKASYIVPIFQRPYSWGEEQIERLIYDLFRGYWGDANDDCFQREPMFLGNMQLTAKYYISQDEWKQDIIDGQQRITTMFLLLKYFQIFYSTEFEKIGLNRNFDWLHTHVTGQESDLSFVQTLDDSFTNADSLKRTNNNYFRNFLLIKNNIESILQENEERIFCPHDFLDYILNDIYFVVVETEATLSETIKIFNTINTAGMDLSCGDLFKIRMSEYLVMNGSCSTIDEAFKIVNALYLKIDKLNDIYNKKYSILTILANYQDYIIASTYKNGQQGLPKSLYRMGADRFFDQLLDGLLNIKLWENFGKIKKLDISLSIQELDDFIDIQYLWDNHTPTKREDMFARKIISTSRYAEYQNVVYIILKRYLGNVDYAYRYIRSISKFFIINSLYYDKKVNFVESLVNDVRSKVIYSNFDNIINDIDKAVKESHIDWLYGKHIKDVIGGYINDSAMRKNLLCRISEYLKECSDNVPLETMSRLLFQTDFDIEHIHANADKSINVDINLQNSIGNLILLERRINRSIQDDIFETKKKGYENSNFHSISNILEASQWTENEIKKRKEKETKAIIKYLFGNDLDQNFGV